MIGHLGQMISQEWPNVRRLSKITSRIKSRATREERSRARAEKVGRVHSGSDSQPRESIFSSRVKK